MHLVQDSLKIWFRLDGTSGSFIHRRRPKENEEERLWLKFQVCQGRSICCFGVSQKNYFSIFWTGCVLIEINCFDAGTCDRYPWASCTSDVVAEIGIGNDCVGAAAAAAVVAVDGDVADGG